MKLIILGGFLGSGKTSVLIPLAKEMVASAGGAADGATKVAIIENEIGYPITMVSNGPGRDDIIYRESPLSK